MTMNEQVDEARAKFADVVANYPNMCGCGTCREALDTAIRQFVLTKEHSCTIWMAQIGAALSALARISMMQECADQGANPFDAYEIAEKLAMESDRIMGAYIGHHHKLIQEKTGIDVMG